MGKVPVRRLRGANVFIQAEPGLTAEWLELTLTKHIAAMRSSAMTDCALDIDDVTVQVSSTGAGFAVRIAAHDSDKAKEILRRVRLPR
jgi:predicted GNAT family acetyltransferase